MNKSRSYTMSARKESAEKNALNILSATVELWKEKSIPDITLEAVAERSGVTVRTILRKYGSKEGLMEATLESESKQAAGSRFFLPPGNLPSLIQALIEDYESYGDASIRTLQSEETIPIAKKINALGRQYHENWCADVFRPYLPDFESADYRTRLLSFYSATDVYLWKVLRRDFGMSPEKTHEILTSLVEGLIIQYRLK